eukprot:4701704-Pleurochrysis_carterae.AAC.2
MPCRNMPCTTSAGAVACTQPPHRAACKRLTSLCCACLATAADIEIRAARNIGPNSRSFAIAIAQMSRERLHAYTTTLRAEST